MADFEIKIDFAQDSRDPARVFRAMAGLIDSFARFDRAFLDTIDLPITSEILLHDIERGSVKAILRWFLRLPDQEALRDGDWKKVLGRIIDDARTLLLKKLEDDPAVTERERLEDIQKGLLKIASTAPAVLIQIPRKIPLSTMLTTVQSFEASTRVLIEGDKASYKSEYSETRISTEIVVNPSLQEELLEITPIQEPTRVQLPVKKPDLIGASQWDLYIRGRVVRVKILDSEWLSKFHNQPIELKPGDSLDALLEITLLKSPEGEIVGYRYQVPKVFDVIHSPRAIQTDFLNDELQQGPEKIE